MRPRAAFGVLLIFLATAFSCGPRQFGNRTAPDQPEGGRGFQSVTEEEDDSNVIVSDETDEAWHGIETDGGEDWYGNDDAEE